MNLAHSVFKGWHRRAVAFGHMLSKQLGWLRTRQVLNINRFQKHENHRNKDCYSEARQRDHTPAI